MVRPVQRQRGVALIVALLVVALAVVLIAGLIDRGELSAARARNGLRAAQAQAYAQGLEAYAARVLLLAQQAGGSDANDSAWAVPLPPTPVPGGSIVASMRDRNGCFNLNNLLDANGGGAATWQHRFTRLLRLLKLDENLGAAVVAWMSPEPAPEDATYLQADPPYRAAKRGFVHVSELRLVKGVDADVYARLAPEVCALPRGTKININTASVAVLMALSDNLDEAAARALWRDGHANNASIAALTQNLPDLNVLCPNLGASPTCPIDVHSSYFLARADIVLDDLPFTWFSLIEFRQDKSHGGPRVIERSRGSD
jgi:general secretion pathway protein K